jgi:NitT/TauT family transport system substrate-binding protein
LNVRNRRERMNKKLLVIILIVAVLSSVGGYWYLKPTMTKPTLLLLGHQRHASNAPYYVAAEKGFFIDEGLNVTFIEFRSVTKIIEALVAGSVDIGTVSLFHAVQAYDNGIDLRIANDAGHTDQDHEGSFIVVRKNSTIESVADLRGKTIAISSWGSHSQFTLELILEKYNLTINDVNVVTLPFDTHLEALMSGRVDATHTSEPYLTYGLDMNVSRKLCPTTGWIFPDQKFQVAATGFMKNFLDEHKDIVDAFIRAYARAVEWMENHPDETREILSKYTGYDVDFITRMNAYAFSEDLDVELVDRCLNLMWERGFLQNKIAAANITYTP